MGALRIVVVIAAMAATVELAMATNYTVGAPVGLWDLMTDYTQWVADKTFKTGDNLFFSYDASFHDLVEVSKSDYDQCTNTTVIASYTDGSTNIPLTTAGTRYFICSAEGHCDAGQKVQIDIVASAVAPTTSPAMAPSPKHHAPSPRHHHAPSPSHIAPSPKHHAPSPKHHAPSPSHIAPSPKHYAPSPKHHAPSPKYHAPSPMYRSHAPHVSPSHAPVWAPAPSPAKGGASGLERRTALEVGLGVMVVMGAFAF